MIQHYYKHITLQARGTMEKYLHDYDALFGRTQKLTEDLEEQMRRNALLVTDIRIEGSVKIMPQGCMCSVCGHLRCLQKDLQDRYVITTSCGMQGCAPLVAAHTAGFYRLRLRLSSSESRGL